LMNDSKDGHLSLSAFHEGTSQGEREEPMDPLGSHRNLSADFREDTNSKHDKAQNPVVRNKNLELSSYFAGEPTQDDPFEAVFQPKGGGLHETPTTAVINKPAAPVTAPVANKSAVSLDSATLNRLRQRDAWLPSETTKSALNQQAQGKQSADVAEIKPVLSPREGTEALSSGADLNKLNDPYHALLLNYLRDEATVDALRHVPNPVEQTTVGPENLKELIVSCSYVKKQKLLQWIFHR
uniref:DNA-directed RNA polymerase III subunit RPC5 n=1 Tax=Echinostoma caproni TaxID=27848 RepID=A0A183BG54_9TREM